MEDLGPQLEEKRAFENKIVKYFGEKNYGFRRDEVRVFRRFKML